MVATEPTIEAGSAAKRVPLVVDLDALLVASGLVGESLVELARRRPLDLCKVAFWRAAGRPVLASRLLERTPPDRDPGEPPRGLLAYLADKKEEGVPLVLVTDADRATAEALAGRLGEFDTLISAEDGAGATGEERRERLVSEFGAGGFDYLGASPKELPVWAEARRAVLVAAHGSHMPDEVGAQVHVDRVFEAGGTDLPAMLAAMRPHQWSKNLLVLLPLGPGRLLYDPALALEALVAIVAFSLTASSGYIFNDLMDLPSDRHHPRKRNRPLAAGRLRVGRAMALTLVLLAAGLVLGAFLSAAFLGILAVYYASTIAYSWRLKNLLVLDVLVLAGLYGLRVAGGAVAMGIPPSAWLLAFCLFIFLSLAMVKRYAELITMRGIDGGAAHARAYLLEDAELLASLGAASGFISVLVLALYADSAAAHELYRRPELLWLVCPLLLYWITYTWLMTHRGRIGDDPTVFAVRDRVSLVLILLMLATMVAAA